MKRPGIWIAVVLLALPSFAASRRRAATPPLAGPAGACQHAVLATSYYSNDIAVDDTYAYFADDAGGLFRVPKSGGSVTRLAQLNDESTFQLIVLDGDTMYLGASDDSLLHGTIYSMPKSGGTPTALVHDVVTQYDMVVDAANLYWTSFGTPTADGDLQADGKVERATKSGANRLVLASNLSGPTSLVVDDAKVYFAESGIAIGSSASGLRVVPKNGGSVASVIDGAAVVALTSSGNDLYFSAYDSLADRGAIARVAKSGGTVTTLQATDGVLSLSLQVRGDELYAHTLTADFEGIDSLSLTDGSAKYVVTADLDTSRFALDDCALYYVTFFDSVERTPR
jgi:hypothetical protein